MITRRDLARALGAANVTDWLIVERVQELGRFDQLRGLRRHERRTRVTVVAHQDQPSGRGSVRLEVAGHDSARELVGRAVQLATSAIGPAWKSPPPAAPAKVDIFEAALADQDLVEVAASLARTARSRGGIAVSGAIEVLREEVTVQSRAGLDARWRASHIHADLLAATGEHSLAIARQARRVANLELERAVTEAAADLERLAAARAPTPGRYAIVLATDAMLHEDTGVWAIFAAQADAVLERQGLTRYRIGAPIVAGAPALPEPLSVTSDGALPFATLSAPIGDEGDAIRRFPIVERGIAVGLGLSSREAVLRGKDPNGGVRNLVVSPGTWTGELPAGPTLEVRRLRALAIDRYTGDASLEIALGVEHAGAARRPFTGGTIRLDLIAALARARRHASIVQRGAYAGPTSLLLDAVDVS